jgi:outer membrane usher protein
MHKLLPILLLFVSAAGIVLPLAAAPGPDSDPAWEPLVLALHFDQEPDWHLQDLDRRLLLRFDELSREQLADAFDPGAVLEHPLIQRAGVVQPSGRPPALAIELTAAVEPTVELGRNGSAWAMHLTLTPRQVSAAQSVQHDRPGVSKLEARIAPRSGGTRLVLETAEVVAFTMHSAGPARDLEIGLDSLGATQLNQTLADLIDEDHPLIAGFSTSPDQPGRTRLRLRLHRRATATIFNLQPDNGFAHRLVIDLVPVPATPAPPRRAPAPDPQPSPDHSTRSRTPAPEARQETIELMWLEASLNQQRRRHTVLARRVDGRLYVDGDDLAGAWSLRLPDTPHDRADGQSWYALDRLGIAHELDSRRLTLDMNAPPGLFTERALAAGTRQRLAPTPSPPGAFFNYDLSTTHSDGQLAAGSLFELGAFNGWGTLTSSAVGRHGEGLSNRGLVRMDTTLRRDWPESMRTVVIGDAISPGTAWSGAVRFGGVQWSNNFELQPELVTLPLLSLAGEAELPSTVEVYINDALRMREAVDPGHFDIDQLPVVTGSGQARLVVTDILGRQQVITQDFYATRRQLRQGLHDWSWELGAVRENYGLEDFDYGRGFISGTHRYGISSRLTGEAHVQHSEDHTTLGAGAVWVLPFGGMLDASAAISDNDLGSGELLAVGIQRQGRRFSLGASAQFADAEFTRLGMSGRQPLPARQLRAHATLRAFRHGSLSLSWTEQRRRESDDFEFLTLRLSQRIANVGFFSISAAHYFDSGDNALSTSLTIPMGQQRTSASLGASWREDRSHASANLRRNLPTGTGYGYNLQLRAGDGSFQRGGLAWQNDYGTWQAEASHRAGTTATRAQASGGVAWLGGDLFAARSIRDSFGVVQVPGFEGVRVYAENQEVGRTNDRGNALVPRMRPYQRNRLRIEQADLPLGTTIDGLEAEVAPYWRSGVVVAFPVRRTRDAFFRILLEDGEPLPLGAAIFDEHGEVWPVGHRGETFITGLDEYNRFDVRHNGRQCGFELAVPDSDEPLLDLGTVTCRETR